MSLGLEEPNTNLPERKIYEKPEWVINRTDILVDCIKHSLATKQSDLNDFYPISSNEDLEVTESQDEQILAEANLTEINRRADSRAILKSDQYTNHKTSKTGTISLFLSEYTVNYYLTFRNQLPLLLNPPILPWLILEL